MTDTPKQTPADSEQQPDKLAREQEFIRRLVSLIKNDKGRLAILRRNAGSSFCEARGVAWFHTLLDTSPGYWDEEACFLVATLFASAKDALEGKNHFTGNFGATLRALRDRSGKNPSDQSPLDRRFNILLDADFDPANGGELAYRLRQMTKRIVAEKDPLIRVNWPQLLRDVKRWNDPRKRARKDWARSYYTPFTSQNTDQTTSPEK